MQIFRAPPQANSQAATASTVEIDPPILGLDATEVRAGLEEIVTALSGSTIQLSDWSGAYEVGAPSPLEENITLVLPEILSANLNQPITIKRMDRTAFTVTIQASTGQTTTITTPNALNTYGGQITFQVKTSTSSEQIANPVSVPSRTTAVSIEITPAIVGLPAANVQEGFAEVLKKIPSTADKIGISPAIAGLTATNVQAGLTEVLAKIPSTADKIGLAPAIAGLTATNVQTGLTEIVSKLSSSTIQLSDWSGAYEVGAVVELESNIILVLPEILAGDLNRTLTVSRMDRTAFTVTIQAPTGQATTMTTPNALNAYGGRITFQAKTLTSSEQIANPDPAAALTALSNRITLLEGSRLVVQTEDDIPNPTGFLTGTQCYVSDTTSTYTVFGIVGQNGLGWAVG